MNNNDLPDYLCYHIGAWLFKTYMSTPGKIALTTIRILNERIFPYNSEHYDEWNIRPEMVSFIIYIRTSLFYITN